MTLILDHVPPPSASEKKEALRAAMRKAAEHGITAIHDPGIDVDDVQLYKQLADEGFFTLRSEAMFLGVSGDSGKAATPSTPMIVNYRDVFSIRAVKFFMDGALGSWGAAMLEPYSDKPESRGELRLSETHFRSNVSAWIAAGYQVATHAIGDRANRIVLNAYRDECFAKPPHKRDLRLRIEHFQIVNQSDIARLHVPTEQNGTCILGKSGLDLSIMTSLSNNNYSLLLVASMQPTHATSDASYVLQRLGAKRLKGAYAWTSALKETTSHLLPFGSDWPTVGRVPPLLGVFAAVTRQDPTTTSSSPWSTEQCVSRAQALKGYTIEAAQASFREKEQGRLDVGMKADFIVMDRDVASEEATPDDKDILDTHILGTFLGGRQVWQSPCWFQNRCTSRDKYVSNAIKEALLPTPSACS